MRPISKIPSLLLLSALAAYAAEAAVSMPQIFSDHMVLQRQKPVKIWGKASPGALVEAEFLGDKKSARAGESGEWSLFLGPFEADSKGAELSVSENGRPQKKFSDVAVGEVWVLAGQSNMEYTVNGYGKKHFDAENILAAADDPNIRIARGTWARLTPENAKKLSVLGFHFGKLLRKDLGDIPVGFIQKTMGGAAMMAFMPRSSMEKIPYLKKYCEDWDKSMVGYDYKKALAAHKAKVEQRKADIAAKRPAKPIRWRDTPSPRSSCALQYTPSSIFDPHVKPIAGYTVRGVLWYQGESDAEQPSAQCFAEQMEELVRSWREAWGEPNMPFYQVLLASFERTSDDWPAARLGQMKSAKNANTGIVNAIDLGEKADIHPQKKFEVARRLERAVMRDIFGRRGIPQNFATFERAEFDGNSAKLRLGSDKSSVFLKGPLRGVEIKTAKGGDKWREAPGARLDGNTLAVSCEEGDEITGVRHLWKNWAQDDVCLWIADDMPLFPFMLLKN